MTKKRKRKTGRASGKLLAKLDTPLTYRIVFISFLFISSLIFFRKLFSVEDFGYRKDLQIFIYVGLISTFAYLGWESFSKEWNKKILFALSIIGFILLIGVYALSFDPVLDRGGDNAFYIIGAKSLASFQGYRLLYEPGAPPNTWGAPGLSFLLTPVIWVAGMDIVAFKMVPYCLAVLLIALSAIFFKNYVSLPVALIIVLLIATNTMVIHYSSLVLTEIPFIFFSMFALIQLDKFEKERSLISKYLFLSGFLVVFTYWIRQIGLLFLVTSILYFILKRYYKKAFALASVVVILFLLWRIRCIIVHTPGTPSAFDFFTSRPGESSLLVKTISSITANLKIAANVVPQEIFNYQIAARKIMEPNLLVVVVLIFTAIGWVWHLIRRNSQMDLYFLAIPLPILARRHWSCIELSRYFVVLIPFLVYYFFNGLTLIFNQFSKKLKVPEKASHTIVLVVLSLVLFACLLGASDRIQNAHRSEPYNPGYTRFLETAYWAKENTPEDAIFAVRKSRTFYLLSNRYATLYEKINGYDSWSEEAEEKTLDLYKEKDIDYLVYDQFSKSGAYLLYPIIKNNPEKFTIIYATEYPETYVLKLNKWW